MSRTCRHISEAAHIRSRSSSSELLAEGAPWGLAASRGVAVPPQDVRSPHEIREIDVIVRIMVTVGHAPTPSRIASVE